MRKRHQWLAGSLGVGVVAGLLSGCGSDEGDAAGTGEPVIMGTTDEVQSLDPASGYNVGSWLVFNNVFQSLISFPRGSTTPEPEAAKSCGFTDSASRVYRCVLKDGLKFSNGNSMTAEDVAYSFERTLRINDDKGPAYLLSSIKNIETPDDRTVVFRLRGSDATFPMKIASNAGAIVDHREYPADRLRTDNKIFGSGVYKLDSFNRKKADFSVNPEYKGSAEPKNSGMTLKSFHGDQAALKHAVQRGTVDLAYRGLAAKDIYELEAKTTQNRGNVRVVDGASAEVMHMVFNMKDPVVGKLGVRKAIAHLVDRTALVRDVYQRTAEPLYSVIPAGITGHKTPFFDKYGDRPQRDKAAAALRGAGINGKVKLTLWATPVRFGPATVPAFKEIAQQLNASGLFDAEVKSVPLDEYDKGVRAGKYGVYVRGWLPDYPDPDIFITPFFSKKSVLANNYESKRITDDLIPDTVLEANRPVTADKFAEIQSIVADDLPVLPLWQGKQYAVAQKGIYGIEWSLDASTVPRFWEISKSEE
ncbi:ABC transporter substrate-binding protein [Streptomyces sp. NPDC002055]|uniref:ABC transporter substrate-binding protein n=1 Tax=Streptomyces sp. NPDC002055 TaxID=3154534 RepID=UPI00332D2737